MEQIKIKLNEQKSTSGELFGLSDSPNTPLSAIAEELMPVMIEMGFSYYSLSRLPQGILLYGAT